jgi:hypothetical protein
VAESDEHAVSMVIGIWFWSEFDIAGKPCSLAGLASNITFRVEDAGQYLSRCK